ncbi:hypothetical protein NPJ82_14065 [Sphingomonas sp. NY01]
MIGVFLNALAGELPGGMPIQRAIGRIALAFIDPAPFPGRTAGAAG